MRRNRYGRTPDAVSNEQRSQNSLSELQESAFQRGRYKLNQEVPTGETWIDNKSIYRVVIDIAPLPNATTKNYAIPVRYQEIVKLYGVANDGTTSVFPLPFLLTGALGNGIGIRITDYQTLTVECGADRSGYTKAYVIIEYTK